MAWFYRDHQDPLERGVGRRELVGLDGDCRNLGGRRSHERAHGSAWGHAVCRDEPVGQLCCRGGFAAGESGVCGTCVGSASGIAVLALVGHRRSGLWKGPGQGGKQFVVERPYTVIR